MNLLNGITAIVFDLGGVIVDLDVDKTRTELARLLGTEQPDLYHSNGYHHLFSGYETGLLSSDAFIYGLLQQAPASVTREEIVAAWNAMLLVIPEKRIRMLELLHHRNKLFILSNTNAIHVNRFEQMAPGYATLSELFDATYYSHLIGHRKPNREAFEAVLRGSALKANQTLFVDDLQANIDMALQMGFKTLWIEPGMEVADILV